MSHHDRDWEDLGRNIRDTVDRAINSHNFQQLNQTITRTVDQAISKGTQAVREAMDLPAPGTKKLYGSTAGKTAIGIFGMLVGFPVTLLAAMVILGSLLTPSTILAHLWLILFMLALLATGIYLIFRGFGLIKMVDRFKLYRRYLGQNTHCSLELLASRVGKSKSFVRNDVTRMIRQGLFLEGHLDREGTALITSHETYRHYETSRLQWEQRQRQEAASRPRPAPTPSPTAPARDPRVQEVLDQGSRFLAQIRKCNNDIPGEEISAKISRIELVVQRIFRRAETHPEIIPDLKKLMDYYLPMTVKLLTAYADMDSQPIRGETIEASKREIESTLDTLNLAFENLLDDLFADTAMDVSSDISVLNTLLAQEGLTGSDFSKTEPCDKTGE